MELWVTLRDAKRGEYGGQEIDVSLYEPLLGMLGANFLEYWLTGKVSQPYGSEMSSAAPPEQLPDQGWPLVSAFCHSTGPL